MPEWVSTDLVGGGGGSLERILRTGAVVGGFIRGLMHSGSGFSKLYTGCSGICLSLKEISITNILGV